jgi:hypothetical protein
VTKKLAGHRSSSVLPQGCGCRVTDAPRDSCEQHALSRAHHVRNTQGMGRERSRPRSDEKSPGVVTQISPALPGGQAPSEVPKRPPAPINPPLVPASPARPARLEPAKVPKRRRAPINPPLVPLVPASPARPGRRKPAKARQIRPSSDEVRTILTAITAVAPATQVVPSARVELNVVVELGKKRLVQVSEQVSLGQLGPVAAPELQDFMERLLDTVEKVGTETTVRAAEKIMRGRSSAKAMRMLTENLGPLDDVARKVAAKLEPTDSTRRRILRWWILAGAILLAVGLAAVVPLIGAPLAETVLTNELTAVAALAASIATWLGRNSGNARLG